MKIIHIVPGFGGTFYCGNCLRDSGFTATLKKLGHNAIMVPIYLPLSIDSFGEISGAPVFYGAVNIYLKQKFPFLRNMPFWLEKFFDAPFLLRFAAKKAGSTRADGLEEMTISMLKGESGHQSTELKLLVDWLKDKEKPDVVHLSNALLLGMAKQIKNETGAKVVCSLQDEDVWVDAMHPPVDKEVWELIAERTKDTDALVAVSDFYAERMKKTLKISDDKLFTVPIGINPDDYSVSTKKPDIFTIGYLSRANKENGLHILVDAFIILQQNPKFKHVKLHIAGGSTGDDKGFIKKQLKKLKKANALQNVEFVDSYAGEARLDFLRTISVLSVPVIRGEAFGLYQLEAMACGVPVVQPQLGAFPEIVNKTQGGILYTPNNAEKLAEALSKVIDNDELLDKMSINGRKNTFELYDNKKVTKKMIQIYESI